VLLKTASMEDKWAVSALLIGFNLQLNVSFLYFNIGLLTLGFGLNVYCP